MEVSGGEISSSPTSFKCGVWLIYELGLGLVDLGVFRETLDVMKHHLAVSLGLS